MDFQKLGEERSLAYHREIARRLPDHPEILDLGRENLSRWMARGGASMYYLRRWLDLLNGPIDDLLRFLVDPSEDAKVMRSCGPFAGALSPRDRLRIFDEVRERLEKSA
jgi:hypothetical protein